MVNGWYAAMSALSFGLAVEMGHQGQEVLCGLLAIVAFANIGAIIFGRD
jgi:hypothetical protein